MNSKDNNNIHNDDNSNNDNNGNDLSIDLYTRLVSPFQGGSQDKARIHISMHCTQTFISLSPKDPREEKKYTLLSKARHVNHTGGDEGGVCIHSRMS